MQKKNDLAETMRGFCGMPSTPPEIGERIDRIFRLDAPVYIEGDEELEELPLAK